MTISFDTLSDATTVGTGNASDGTGNFDELMQVVTLHLEAQFAAGRITGTDYATVYLGALQSTLAQAVTFTLNMEKANAEKLLIDAQELKVDADKLLVDAQELKVDAETSLLGKKGATEDKQLLVMTEQIALFEEQAKGFKWNAENKYLKALLDAYAINVSVSKEDDEDTAILQGSASTSSGIAKVIDDMKPTG